MGNIYRNLPDADLLLFGQTLYATANGAPATYDLSPADLVTINTAVTGFDTKLTDRSNKEAAFRASVEAKDDARAALIAVVSMFANQFYADPNIDNAEISALGLAPRDETRTPITPVTVTGLVADPSVNGSVLFTWNRAGNPYGVTFVIEQLGASGWFPIKITNRTRVRINGFTPGTEQSFRVVAQTEDEAAPPSGTVVIYDDGIASLSIAA